MISARTSYVSLANTQSFRTTSCSGVYVLAVGFKPTSANTVELESTPLDRSGTLTITYVLPPPIYTLPITKPSPDHHPSHQHTQNVNTSASATQVCSIALDTRKMPNVCTASGNRRSPVDEAAIDIRHF